MCAFGSNSNYSLFSNSYYSQGYHYNTNDDDDRCHINSTNFLLDTKAAVELLNLELTRPVSPPLSPHTLQQTSSGSSSSVAAANPHSSSTCSESSLNQVVSRGAAANVINNTENSNGTTGNSNGTTGNSNGTTGNSNGTTGNSNGTTG
eukprot:Lankesteria_metandrocarpae@DN8850_c0_g1_i1.p1